MAYSISYSSNVNDLGKYFVTDINNQYRQTVCTKLEVYKHEFPFLIESEKFGRLTYETKGKTKALYTNVIPAYLAGKSYLAGNPKICNFKNADDIIAATKILTVSDAEIIDKFLAFWIPLNSVYRSMNFKTGSLLSKPCLAAGFIIWGQNQQLISPTYLQQKIADSESSVSTIRNASHSFSVGNVEELIDTFLFIFNKSRRSNFLKVNGKTGR